MVMVIDYYNHTKGGVDSIDQRVGTYTTKFACKRWHVVVFTNILDLSLYNAYILHKIVDPQWNNNKSHRRRLYLIAVGTALSQTY